MENWDPAVVRILSIFMPNAFKSRAAITPESRFVHYTTSKNLLDILDSGEIEFQNTRDMNDHNDLEIGVERLQDWIGRSGGTALAESNTGRLSLWRAFERDVARAADNVAPFTGAINLLRHERPSDECFAADGQSHV
ncbi:hypothetical protein [Phyllobacterium myrsinacearum]|uniref:hypothetical protein n=1 Tax=Phyllobacterium myrsinacearum TaxID=28101 RepID=UPI000D713660|nr:hypothetical protein [Phyllobacterium myrsinacearum]PWV90485.1 hypothetical protein DEV92_107209 [Phyllobacterium myrsinacearum]RZV05322.1 hypothetical protein EV654_2767 [Phyllobacterium myrsinacearum]